MRHERSLVARPRAHPSPSAGTYLRGRLAAGRAVSLSFAQPERLVVILDALQIRRAVLFWESSETALSETRLGPVWFLQEAKKNWEEYGNPDGKQALEVGPSTHPDLLRCSFD